MTENKVDKVGDKQDMDLAALAGLRTLMVDAGLRIRSGWVDSGTLILDLEADRTGGGAIELVDLGDPAAWDVMWHRSGQGAKVRRGTASIFGDGWELHVNVAEDME